MQLKLSRRYTPMLEINFIHLDLKGCCIYNFKNFEKL